jgi:hypothetical protein
MSKRQWTESEYRTATVLNILPWLMMLPVIITGAVKGCCGPKANPVDDSINKSREIVEHVIVADSAQNGFRVVYATTDNVTKERLEEIQSRPAIRNTFEDLKKEAPVYFNHDMKETDIYDFAGFTLRYDINPDIELHNIFIYGKEKTDMYARPNPKIENSATWIDPSTGQGIQYLRRDDIYYRRRKKERIYRYWKCFGIHATSLKDERYSHFSEDERLW